MNIRFFDGEYQDRLPVTKQMLTEMSEDGLLTEFTYDRGSKFDEFYSDELVASISAKIPEGLDEYEIKEKYDEFCSSEVLNYCLNNYDSFIIEVNENLLGIKNGEETIILTLEEKTWRDAHSYINGRFTI